LKLLTNYAIAAAAKIGKPFILTKVLPLPFENPYITIHFNSKGAKTYDYPVEFLDLVVPYLESAGIKLIQIGSNGETPLPNVFHTMGCSLNQTAYLLQNSLLHCGVDSFPIHIKSGIDPDPKIVGLYSNANYVENVRPYWGRPENIRLLTHKIKDKKPHFSNDEPFPKSVNSIYPEEIATAVLDLLNIPHKINQQTLRIGSFYNDFIIESVPNQVVDLSRLPSQNFFIRADLEFNLQNIFHQLSVGKASIITAKPLPLPELLKNKQNINQIIYILWPGYSKEFIEDCISNGIRINMVSCKDEEWITAQKIDLFEYGIIHPIKTRKQEDFEELKNIPPENIYYKSRKFLLSKGKIYQGKAAYLSDEPINGFNPTIQKIINNDEFYYDADHFYFLTYSS
jgi:hypothetical protein